MAVELIQRKFELIRLNFELIRLEFELIRRMSLFGEMVELIRRKCLHTKSQLKTIPSDAPATIYNKTPNRLPQQFG